MENDYGTKSRKRIGSLIETGKKKEQPKKGCGCVNKCPHTISNSVGEVVITVVRETFRLQVDLPYCIWGTLYLDTLNFGPALQPYIPVTVPAITVTNTINAAGNIVFTYTNGLETDTIVVGVPSIGLISYGEMLGALKTSYFNTCYMLFNCNAKNNAVNLDNSVILGIQSAGLFLNKVGGTGDKDGQLIIPKSRIGMNNSVPNIIELYLRNEPVKPDSVWVHSVAYVDYGLGVIPTSEYNWTVFMSEQVDMNKKF